jgi:CheY-like chemotaxis protein
MFKKNDISVLLLDDNADLVAFYKEHLEKYRGICVTVETDSRRAKHLADRQLFDMLIIDAKLDYKGFEFGGLRLADDLRLRFGTNGIIVISRYITEAMARITEVGCEFMDKNSHTGRGQFPGALARRIRDLRKAQYAFIAMPFAPGYQRLFAHVRRGIVAAGLKCVRLDCVPHTRAINTLLGEYVQNCKVVVLVADGANANAYYEAGLADAMKKEVVIVARDEGTLLFDLRQRNAILYGREMESIAARLAERIMGLRFQRPHGS